MVLLPCSADRGGYPAVAYKRKFHRSLLCGRIDTKPFLSESDTAMPFPRVWMGIYQLVVFFFVLMQALGGENMKNIVLINRRGRTI